MIPSLGNVQGLVAYRYEQPRYAVLLFSINDPRKARAFLRDWLPRIPRGDQNPKSLVGPVLNICFSWLGLSVMLEGDAELDPDVGRGEFDWAFTDQTPEHPGVSDQLGFIHQSAPGNWWGGHFTSRDIHVAIYAAFDDDAHATATTSTIRQSAQESGLTECKVSAFPTGALSGYRPDDGILHFGYRDGVTTPAVDWQDQRQPGTVNFREFLLGYPSDDYPVPPQKPGPWRDFARDGSFACLAWIHQDVAAFNSFLDENASLGQGHAAPGRERDWLAAKILGRWPDGSPLVRHPHDPPATPDFDDSFDYSADQAGERCPLSAHIRIANTRDQELTFPNQTRFPGGPPRFIRRGFSYGKKLASSTDDQLDRGVVGTFICARINEQFYTILRWMQKSDFSEAFFRKPYDGAMQDALFGNRGKSGSSTLFPIPVAESEALRVQLADFITYKGVGAFFLPSHQALERLSQER